MVADGGWSRKQADRVSLEASGVEFDGVDIDHTSAEGSIEVVGTGIATEQGSAKESEMAMETVPFVDLAGAALQAFGGAGQVLVVE